MAVLKTDAPLFSEVRAGLEWAVDDLPEGTVGKGAVFTAGTPVELRTAKTYKGTAGYSIQAFKTKYVVRAGTAVGFISGILNLAARLEAGEDPEEEIKPHFTSRFYKHEANLGGPSNRHTAVSDLDEEFWVGYCKALVRQHFTGLVFYAHYHPFQYFLDFEEFAEAAEGTPWQREAVLQGLKTAFGVARRFGLETFMQHYVSHFPEALSRALALGIDPGKTNDGRFAAVDHPRIREYTRYVYRRTFELLPELSGFYLNFESAPLAADFVVDTLYSEAARAKVKPSLVIRLWDMTSVPEVRKLVRQAPGHVRLAHKIMDFADVYYYPCADRRCREWKKALPGTEFMYIMGPCHNCATSQSRGLWGDPDFIYETLDDARAKGADSIAFHTVYELLAPDIDAQRVCDKKELAKALLNRPHLDAFIDYVRQRRPDGKVLAERAAGRLGVDEERAGWILEAIKEASQITLLTYQQFFYTSSMEGYLTPPRSNHYNDPFFYLTMRCADEQSSMAMNLTTAWLNTRLRKRYLPEDVQTAVDFADPSKSRVKRGPMTIAGALRDHAEKALALCTKASREEFAARDAFVGGILALYNWGMRVNYEIRIAVSLYRLFFAKTRRAAAVALENAVAEMRRTLHHVHQRDGNSARTLPLMDESAFEDDITLARRVTLHMESANFPFKAFAAYAESVRLFNEIRRTVRPQKTVRAKEERIIRSRLDAALSAAEKSRDLLTSPRARNLQRNVEQWIRYLEAQRDGLTTPSYEVRTESSVGRDEGWVQLVHDQCFRYGESCLSDLEGFFTQVDFERTEPLFFKVVRTVRGLKISLLHRDADMKKLNRAWEKFAGTMSDSFFLRLYIDREGDGERTDVFRIYHGGSPAFREAVIVRSPWDRSIELAVPLEGLETVFDTDKDWWRLDCTIPWKEIGGRVSPGDTWRANITSNPFIQRNRQSIWCRGYEFVPGKASRMGTFLFR